MGEPWSFPNGGAQPKSQRASKFADSSRNGTAPESNGIGNALPMTDPRPIGWRYFRTREVAIARDWAAQGGIAVHENLFKFRGRRTCHLLAINEIDLVEAAVSLGCSVHWIHRSKTPHFDLVEVYLERALQRCGIPV